MLLVWSLFRVSRGVSNIPGNLQSATSNIPSGKSLMYFGLLLASGVFFVFVAFTVFLPVIVIVPQKFALCFTVGCGFIIGSFFMLKGPKNQFLHMTSTERLPFTLGFIGSMVGTIYVSMVDIHTVKQSTLIRPTYVGSVTRNKPMKMHSPHAYVKSGPP
ncbi:putative vesicle transport protein, Got1/SFT2 [Helianthus annuus]|nr:putative vesicle transport protein, Got1/SFT2 [Helianthus annuus]